MLFSNKKGYIPDTGNIVNESHKRDAEWKKPGAKENILYDLLFISSGLKKLIYGRKKLEERFPWRSGGRDWLRRDTGDLSEWR